MIDLKNTLNKAHPALFVIYAGCTAFMTYFCMYAFRKPYTVSSYENMDSPFAGLDFKVALILAQIFGYMLAKFIGVKVVSEMTSRRRAVTLLGLVGMGQVALLGFALTPAPFNVAWLFINGLSLGMIWGIVFSFLEGRRTTELLGAMLACTFIVASGMVRSVGSYLLHDWQVDPLWMPATTGALFALPLMVSVYLLAQLPPPSAQDCAERQQRAPMDGKARWAFFKRFAPGITFLILSFLLFTGFRDFRDNFSAELWTALGHGSEPAIFAYAGIRIAFLVLFALGAMVLIKNNRTAFFANHGFILGGCASMVLSTMAFEAGALDAKLWMVLLGAGLYVAYIPYNCFLFDRMICAVKVTANAGFLLYLADSAGYIGSVSILLYRVFAEPDLSWLTFFIHLVYLVALAGGALVVASLVYFSRVIPKPKTNLTPAIA